MNCLKLSSLVLILTACSSLSGCTGYRSVSSLAEMPDYPLVNLSVANEPVGSVLQKISSITGIAVTTTDEWWAGFPVSLNLTNATLQMSLEILLADLPHTVRCQRRDGIITAIVISAPLAPFGKDSSNNAAEPVPPLTLMPDRSTINKYDRSTTASGLAGVTLGQAETTNDNAISVIKKNVKKLD